MDVWLLSVLRCPLHPDHGPLMPLGSGEPGCVCGLRCRRCGRSYPVIDGIPDLVGPTGCPTALRAAEAAQWDSQAARYDAVRLDDPIYMAGIAVAARALAPWAGESVLDAACGTGLTVHAYDRPGLRVVAADLSLNCLRLLQRAAPRAAVYPVRADLRALPFAAEAFDRALCANAVQHFADEALRRGCLAELARVTRPGGRVVVTAHNWSVPKQRAGWRKEGATGGLSGPVRYLYRFTPAEFRALLASALRVEAVRGAGLPLPYRWKLSWLSRRLEPVLSQLAASASWGYMLVGVGRPPTAGPRAPSGPITCGTCSHHPDSGLGRPGAPGRNSNGR